MAKPLAVVPFGTDGNHEQQCDHRSPQSIHRNQGRPSVHEGGMSPGVVKSFGESFRNPCLVVVADDQDVRVGVMREPALRVPEARERVRHLREDAPAQIPAERLPSGLRRVCPATSVRRRVLRENTSLAPDGASCRRRPVRPDSLWELGTARTAFAAVLQPDELEVFGKRRLPWVSRGRFGASYGGWRAMNACSCAAHVFGTHRRSASGECIGCAAPHHSCRETQFSLLQCNLRSTGNGHETRLYDGGRWSRTRHELVPLAVQRGPLRRWPALDVAGWAGGGSVRWAFPCPRVAFRDYTQSSPGSPTRTRNPAGDPDLSARMGRLRAESPRSQETAPPWCPGPGRRWCEVRSHFEERVVSLALFRGIISVIAPKETDRIKVSNFIAGAVHSSGYRGTRFDAETAVTWKLNFRHPPKWCNVMNGPVRWCGSGCRRPGKRSGPMRVRMEVRRHPSLDGWSVPGFGTIRAASRVDPCV